MLKTVGSGDAKKICILFQENGLGDAICFLPVLWQKISEGYEVTLYGNYFPIYDKLKLTFIDGKDTIEVHGTIDKLQKEFGAIYSFGLRASSIEHEQKTNGIVIQTRFEQFAECLETTVPKEFDFLQFFDLRKTEEKKKIIVSPYSTTRSRKYGLDFELHNLFWEAHNESVIEYEPKFIGLFLQPHEEDIINTIYNAKCVIAIDNGILHLALALGTPVVALMGGSDEWSIVHQYRRFGKMNYSVVRSEIRNKECKRPCSFQEQRGFGVNGKCSGATTDCMDEITPERILEEVQNLLRGI